MYGIGKYKYLLSWVNAMWGGGGKYFNSYADAVDYASDIGINFNNPNNRIDKVWVDA